MIKKLSFVLLMLAGGTAAQAQVDPHFSQYYIYPSWLNPALTGVFDGDYRASAIYRTQWGNITTPFATPGFSVDVNTNRNINFGASVLRQKAGDGGFNYTTAYGSIAYTGVRFGVNGYQRMVFGMQFGLIQRRFDINKLTFGDQWNPITGFNPGTPTADVFNRSSSSSFDAGAGALYYDATPGKKANLYGGVSVSHITRPTDQFSATGDAKFPVRYTVHAGSRINLNPTFSITPNALYLKQGTASETMVGAYGQLKAAPDLDLMFGANYRLKDAVAPYVGIGYKNMMLGLNYDINTSDLGKLARGSRSFEISLSIIGKKRVKTPEAEFVCPRL
ncbi:MAG: PorP/SprF family type IX secretion system membrane protein [Dinghuibacter sp.]|nr:PorP/SprF family type IX secretion system membrane protein [Dinghuibacter sp.]